MEALSSPNRLSARLSACPINSRMLAPDCRPDIPKCPGQRIGAGVPGRYRCRGQQNPSVVMERHAEDHGANSSHAAKQLNEEVGSPEVFHGIRGGRGECKEPRNQTVSRNPSTSCSAV